MVLSYLYYANHKRCSANFSHCCLCGGLSHWHSYYIFLFIVYVSSSIISVTSLLIIIFSCKKNPEIVFVDKKRLPRQIYYRWIVFFFFCVCLVNRNEVFEYQFKIIIRRLIPDLNRAEWPVLNAVDAFWCWTMKALVR